MATPSTGCFPLLPVELAGLDLISWSSFRFFAGRVVDSVSGSSLNFFTQLEVDVEECLRLVVVGGRGGGMLSSSESSPIGVRVVVVDRPLCLRVVVVDEVLGALEARDFLGAAESRFFTVYLSI